MQIAHKVQLNKYPRFGKYVSLKAQWHSRQRHFLVINLKEFKFAERSITN